MTVPSLARVLSGLRRFSAVPETRCDLCGAMVDENDHPHLFEVGPRRIQCACGACALLFASDERTRYRRILPVRTPLSAGQLTESVAAGLDLPVSLALLAPSPHHNQLFAHYPNSRGVVEASIPLARWRALVARVPALEDLRGDAEALVVDERTSSPRYARVSLDCAYALLGQLHRLERGAGTAWQTFEVQLSELWGDGHA